MSSEQFQQLLDSIGEMESRFELLWKDVHESQTQAMQEVVKSLQQQGGYTFQKGNEIQYKFNAEVDDTLQKAKRDIATLADDIQEAQRPALRKAQESLDEGITAITTRKKRIKLEDHSEFGWNMVACMSKINQQ